MLKSKYTKIHSWLRKTFGLATKCESKNCKKVSTFYEYALKQGKEYCYKRANYLMLCRSCHTKYDEKKDTRIKKANFHRGRKRSEKTKQLMRLIALRKGTQHPPLTKEQKEKQRKRMKGNTYGFKKGMIPWNRDKKCPKITGENHYLYGKHRSKETKSKISLAKKGKPSWNKGKKCPHMIGNTNGFKKGFTPWNKGKKYKLKNK